MIFLSPKQSQDSSSRQAPNISFHIISHSLRTLNIHPTVRLCTTYVVGRTSLSKAKINKNIIFKRVPPISLLWYMSNQSQRSRGPRFELQQGHLCFVFTTPEISLPQQRVQQVYRLISRRKDRQSVKTNCDTDPKLRTPAVRAQDHRFWGPKPPFWVRPD